MAYSRPRSVEYGYHFSPTRTRWCLGNQPHGSVNALWMSQGNFMTAVFDLDQPRLRDGGVKLVRVLVCQHDLIFVAGYDHNGNFDLGIVLADLLQALVQTRFVFEICFELF